MVPLTGDEPEAFIQGMDDRLCWFILYAAPLCLGVNRVPHRLRPLQSSVAAANMEDMGQLDG